MIKMDAINYHIKLIFHDFNNHLVIEELHKVYYTELTNMFDKYLGTNIMCLLASNEHPKGMALIINFIILNISSLPHN